MGNNIIIKTPEQIRSIREASKLAAKALAYTGNLVRAGVTTNYLNDEVEKFIRDNGGTPASLNYRGFPKAICTSVNNVVCHGIPDETILKDGDIVSLDIAVILDGYFGDNCKTYPVGEISKKAKTLLKVTEKCLYVGIKEVYPGNYFGNIGYKIKKLASNYNFGVVDQFTGHGVGIRYHEDPEVFHDSQKNSGAIMKPGMIFTIEPMINAGVPEVEIDKKDRWTVRTKDVSLSAQFEHTLLVTKKGVEVLTMF